MTLIAVVGTAAMGGVFFAFSAFVMAALGRLPAPQAIAAMQSINVTAVRPAFMTALFGTAALCVWLGLRALPHLGERRSALMLTGALLYLLGTIALTGGYHVPLNDKLALLDPNAPASAAQWTTYLHHWTLLNHVRTASAIGAAAAFLAALRTPAL